MGSLRIPIKDCSSLRWPSCCMVCGASAELEAITSISTSSDFQFMVMITWTRHTFSIAFPVCRKHKIICRLLDVPARLSFIYGFLYLIIVPLILWIVSTILIAATTGLKGDMLDPYSNALGIFFYGSTVLLYVVAVTFRPVKLSAIDDTSVTLTVRNSESFKRFQLLNSRHQGRTNAFFHELYKSMIARGLIIGIASTAVAFWLFDSHDPAIAIAFICSSYALVGYIKLKHHYEANRGG